MHYKLIQACLEKPGNDQGMSGKRKAQYELYKLYYKAMYNTALNIVKHPHEAEDIMQNSFIDAFGKLDSWNGSGTFGSWLKRIVINNSVDATRKHREYRLLDEEELEIQDVSDEDYYQNVDAKVEEIRHAMFQLGNEDRTVLSLFLLEGYNHEEIAAILNISYNASRTRYSRARHRLCILLNAKILK